MATASQIAVSPAMQVVRVFLVIFTICFWYRHCFFLCWFKILPKHIASVLSYGRLSITGFCLFVIGIWATAQMNKYEDLPTSNYVAVSIVLIVIGLFIALIGICGCCGALRKSIFLLKMFSLFLGIIIICEISVAIAGYAYRTKIKSALHDGLKNTMTDAYRDDSIIRGVWDKMQQSFHCCGNDNYTDWFNVTWTEHPTNMTTVPESCCKDERKGCNSYQNVRNSSETDAEKFIYTEGCYGLITDFFQQKFYVLASAALSIALIQFFSIACAGCFWNHVQKKTKYELV